VPTLLVVHAWTLSGTPIGNATIYFAPNPENSVPDPTGLSFGDIAFETGIGNCAFLKTPGRWAVIFGCSEFAASQTCAFVLYDATNPSFADQWMRDCARRPTDTFGPLGGSDIVLAGATTTILFVNQVDVVTAIIVTNVGAAPGRVYFGTSGAGAANSGIPMAVGQTRTFEGPTLPAGDLYGFSTVGTTFAVNGFSRVISHQ
jgi:hypothetical protein